MKILRTALLALALCVAPTFAEKTSFSTDGVISLYSVSSIGHACPVGPDGTVLTAKHVAYSREGHPQYFAWGNALGMRGTADPIWASKYFDLAKLRLNKKVPYYELAKELPKEGAPVYWQEFSEVDARNVTRKGKFRYTEGGYIFIEKAVQAGASGGCLFNEEGKVIGINVWGPKSVKPIGISVDLIGTEIY
jgi:hypothetical protein